MKTAKFLLPVIALFFLLNCAASKPETTKAENVLTTIDSQNTAASAAAETAVDGSATTQQTSAPDALVKDLYNVHGKDYSKIMNGKSRVLLDKYFDKNLADLIWKDLTTHKEEVGVLDFDPFYNAQDVNIKKLTVAAPKIQNDKAEVTVNFENYGNKETITYALVKQNTAWKISDIKYKDGGSLLKYFKDYANNSASQTETADANFEGTYQVGETTCEVKPVKMAFEVRWAKGSGTEMFIYEHHENEQHIYTSQGDGKRMNIFALNENLDSGEFIRADGKRFAVKKIK
jgi:hypothetical protein